MLYCYDRAEEKNGTIDSAQNQSIVSNAKHAKFKHTHTHIHTFIQFVLFGTFSLKIELFECVGYMVHASITVSRLQTSDSGEQSE